MNLHNASVVDGILDQDAAVDIHAPNRVLIPVKFPFTPMTYDIMRIRHWHVTNYTDLLRWCTQRNINLVHLFDGVRVVTRDGFNPVLRHPVTEDPVMVAEFATPQDVMLFKLSWIN